MPNPILEIGGYEPVTEYWPSIIALTNSLLYMNGSTPQTAKELQAGGNAILTGEIFANPNHTAVEWAEMVMAINHMLWFLHGVQETEKLDYLDKIMQALNDLYYEWHDKALSVLKGDALSEYLQITD